MSFAGAERRASERTHARTRKRKTKERRGFLVQVLFDRPEARISRKRGNIRVKYLAVQREVCRRRGDVRFDLLRFRCLVGKMGSEQKTSASCMMSGGWGDMGGRAACFWFSARGVVGPRHAYKNYVRGTLIMRDSSSWLGRVFAANGELRSRAN